MEDEVKVETVVEPVIVAPVVETKVEKPVLTKNDILREISKEYGVNLFEPEGLKQFKEYSDSQKTELDKAQELISAFETEKQGWESKQLEYESKLKASELGISPDNIEDALKLAGNDPSKLAEVVKKYPMFQSKTGITIGIQKKEDQKDPSGFTEAEQYAAGNPRFQEYARQKKIQK